MPFLALVVLDLGNLLEKYGIEGATVASRGNEQVLMDFSLSTKIHICPQNAFFVQIPPAQTLSFFANKISTDPIRARSLLLNV